MHSLAYCTLGQFIIVISISLDRLENICFRFTRSPTPPTRGRCPLSRYWAELCPGCVGEAQGEGLVIIISIIRANKETEQIKKSASSIILLWQTWNLLVCQTTFFFVRQHVQNRWVKPHPLPSNRIQNQQMLGIKNNKKIFLFVAFQWGVALKLS